MHPVLKRILLHGGITAAILLAVGGVFAQMAGGVITRGGGPPGAPALPPPVDESLRYRVPLMMALWGFAFVAACELVLSRIRGNKPAAKPAGKLPDETEKLLNELLAQAEAKMAAEAASQK